MASQSSSMEAIGLLALLAVQFGTQPFLAKSCTPGGVLKSSLVVSVEIIKLFASLIVLMSEGRLSEVIRSWSFKGFIYSAGVPSITYLIQGYCIQVAYQELDAVAFNVLNQTKLLFTAIFVYVFTGREQSKVQCIALLFIAVSGALMSLSEFSDDTFDLQTSVSLEGLIAICLGSALSGLGAGITEKVLREQKRNNYQLTGEMSAIGIILVTASLFLGIAPDSESWKREGLFSHWRASTVIPVITQALAGVVVGLITKVAGSVQKSFATICGIALTCLVRAAVTGELPSLMARLAVLLACLSIYAHATNPQKIG